MCQYGKVIGRTCFLLTIYLKKKNCYIIKLYIVMIYLKLHLITFNIRAKMLFINKVINTLFH